MKKKNGGRVARFGIFFAISMIISVTITVSYVQGRIQLEQSQMEQIAMSRANKVSTVLTKLLYKTQVLSATVVRGGIVDFEQMAATILDDPAIKNLILAPNGVVTHVYPISENKDVLGLNFFSEGTGNLEAMLARDTGELVLGGPFESIQGGKILVGRLPIYENLGKFWGIVSVTLHYPDALNGAELDQLESLGYAYEIWRISPDTQERQTIDQSQYGYNANARFVEYPMNILNAQWYFRLSPIRAWYEFPETWVFSITGLVISILVGCLMMHNYDLGSMKKGLEELSLRDPLTGILNRRGGFQALQKLEGNAPYTLCYMDLDCFKEINDVLGHNAGDFVLQSFTERIQRNLTDKNCVFSRVGGDEFILVFYGIWEENALQEWLNQLTQKEFSTPLQWEGHPIKLAFSAGHAIYQQDGATLDEILAIADRKMYANKNMKKAQGTSKQR